MRFLGGLFLGKISVKNFDPQKKKFGKSSETPKKIILSEIGKISIFDPTNLGVQTHRGSKWSMHLDSPWVVSY